MFFRESGEVDVTFAPYRGLDQTRADLYMPPLVQWTWVGMRVYCMCQDGTKQGTDMTRLSVYTHVYTLVMHAFVRACIVRRHTCLCPCVGVLLCIFSYARVLWSNVCLCA